MTLIVCCNENRNVKL